ncbi:MAG: polyhydroxyalkanoate depolymerase, partial [Pseudomonadota bacterium]
SPFLYNTFETYRQHLQPLLASIKLSQFYLDYIRLRMPKNAIPNYISSYNEFMIHLLREYDKPEFDIESTTIDGVTVPVKEYKAAKLPFCNLLHFQADHNSSNKREKLLIVAPMSGHHATLLRGTVKDTLPHFDVYITDWIDAKLIPTSAGGFDMDDYIEYVMYFLKFLCGDTHVMAVCQPTVPVLAAVSLMAAENNPCTPKSMILMGGPVDARQSPTEVNRFAVDKHIYFFESKLITKVPYNYSGYGRSVYPGFLQLLGFISMNMKRHIGAHSKYFEHLISGDGDSVDSHRKFYNEYLSVMDITSEFYLQTIQRVFQDYNLPTGNFTSRGRYVDPGKIKDTKLIVVEGERDDISGVGQTKAAIDLCHNLPKKLKHYHLQDGVGHYGVFNGSRFRNSIVPVIAKQVYGQ